MRKGAHPKHPKCPACGRPLYKAATKGAKTKKTDPWIYCRNPNCKESGNKHQNKPHHRIKKSRPSVLDVVEPPAVQKARKRIQSVIPEKSDEATNIIGLTLALMAQELGNNNIADQLIDEYDLTELYGIQKTQ